MDKNCSELRGVFSGTWQLLSRDECSGRGWRRYRAQAFHWQLGKLRHGAETLLRAKHSRSPVSPVAIAPACSSENSGFTLGSVVTFPSLDVNLGMKVGDRASAFLSFFSASQRLSPRAVVPTLRDGWGGGRVATGDGPSQAPWLHPRAGREVSALRRPVPRWPGDPLASLPALPSNAR